MMKLQHAVNLADVEAGAGEVLSSSRDELGDAPAQAGCADPAGARRSRVAESPTGADVRTGC
jgi:uncharacterized radical SAM superfamily protein